MGAEIRAFSNRQPEPNFRLLRVLTLPPGGHWRRPLIELEPVGPTIHKEPTVFVILADTPSEEKIGVCLMRDFAMLLANGGRAR